MRRDRARQSETLFAYTTPGNDMAATASRYHDVYARWRRYRRYSTGIIGDLLVHRISPLAMALDLGWPTRVVASGGHYVDTAMENHDQVLLTVEFEKGHTMVIAGSTSNETGLEILTKLA